MPLQEVPLELDYWYFAEHLLFCYINIFSEAASLWKALQYKKFNDLDMGIPQIHLLHPIRYLPSLLTQFLCTVCTASCKL